MFKAFFGLVHVFFEDGSIKIFMRCCEFMQQSRPDFQIGDGELIQICDHRRVKNCSHGVPLFVEDCTPADIFSTRYNQSDISV